MDEAREKIPSTPPVPTTLPGFTAKHNVKQLVFYEDTNDVHVAIIREKQFKGWFRANKIALIESFNPNWFDLAADWYEPETSVSFRATARNLAP